MKAVYSILDLEALAGSVVKIAGRDVLATWKVLIALGVTPVLYLFYAIAATLVAIRAKAPMKWRILTPILTMWTLPFISVAALKFGEAGMDVLKLVTSPIHEFLSNPFKKVVATTSHCDDSRSATISR